MILFESVCVFLRKTFFYRLKLVCVCFQNRMCSVDMFRNVRRVAF